MDRIVANSTEDETKSTIFFINDLDRERIMNLTKNARGELYDGVQKREKWVRLSFHQYFLKKFIITQTKK
jgi:hypothetical protein